MTATPAIRRQLGLGVAVDAKPAAIAFMHATSRLRQMGTDFAGQALYAYGDLYVEDPFSDTPREVRDIDDDHGGSHIRHCCGPSCTPHTVPTARLHSLLTVWQC